MLSGRKNSRTQKKTEKTEKIMKKYAGSCQYQYPFSDVVCGKKVSPKVYGYSKDKYGMVMCYGHQKQIDFKDEGYESVKDYEESQGVNYSE